MTNPLWVVKTRFMVGALCSAWDVVHEADSPVQAQAVLPPSAARYRNTADAIATIYRSEGFKAFYKGLLPSLMGVTHVAVQFPLYEAFKSWAGGYLPPTPSSVGANLRYRPRWEPLVPSSLDHPHLLSGLENDRITSDLPTRSPSHPTPNRQSPLAVPIHPFLASAGGLETALQPLGDWIEPSPSTGRNPTATHSRPHPNGQCPFRQAEKRRDRRYRPQDQTARWMEGVL